ncbi:MAG: TMEM165/GDT1 family protein [Deltaproteobacteria bacterium]|nr:TMEM165/GDT1 family protein [Deltaproteobacteria bacterium]
MDLSAFVSTLGLVFVAELGDKTQLATLALAARYPWRPVLAGVVAAFALLNAAAVTVGGVAAAAVPPAWIQAAAGGLFLLFGGLSFVSRDGPGDEDGPGARSLGPFGTSFLLILVSELGDKTQLATAGLAARWAAPLEVFAGSCLALWGVSGLALAAGVRIHRWIPARRIRRIAGLLFLAFGLATLWPLVVGRP